MILEERGISCDRIARGNRLIIGNGSYGYRGTLEEHTKKNCVALTTCGFYDQSGSNWREPVNMPNPLYLTVEINGSRLNEDHVIDHRERLNLDNGVFERETVYLIDDIKVLLHSIRFFLQTRNDLLVSKLQIKCDKECEMVVCSGIDYDVWNINGKHFYLDKTETAPLKVFAHTNENKDLWVAVEEKATVKPRGVIKSKSKLLNKYVLVGESFEVEKYCTLSHTNLPASGEGLENYGAIARQNDRWWRERWKRSKVTIDDENDLALAVQHSIYQLIIYAPKVENLSISARGLSGQTYKGAVFWDTEMFMIPYYLKTDPETAKRLIRYRINSLSGALLKAKEYGYSGAFYAWESQENGYDACSDFNVVDVFTGRAVRTYFKDKQIHISADIAVCLFDVYKQTKDLSILTDGGAEMLIQCALFYYYRAYYNHIKDRFELLDVMGPDEYHDGVNNNAYTNYMAHETACVTIKALEILKKKSPEHYNELMGAHKKDIEGIRKFKNKLYLPVPDENGVIEQFDGYFKLEDVLPCDVRARLVHPSEYWGGSNGVATATRVIKQADVVALMCVLPHRFTTEVKRANYTFYLPYTEHGSSLSASMYARCGCMVGLQDDAYKWFVQTATCDLSGNSKQFAGKLYIGGTHPASCGGTWLTLYEGFAKNAPRLPKQVRSLSISTINGTKVYEEKDD